MTNEEQSLRKVRAHLARMSTALHALLNEINPPAIAPLPPHTDVGAEVWTEAGLRAFSIVHSLSETVDQALKDVNRLRTGTLPYVAK